MPHKSQVYDLSFNLELNIDSETPIICFVNKKTTYNLSKYEGQLYNYNIKLGYNNHLLPFYINSKNLKTLGSQSSNFLLKLIIFFCANSKNLSNKNCDFHLTDKQILKLDATLLIMYVFGSNEPPVPSALL